MAQAGGVTRSHTANGKDSLAVYSPCMAYRYDLVRIWDTGAPRALFIGLNPSTATEIDNDPTVERCERRARAMGYGAFRMGNIFALRATDPKVMRAHSSPIGSETDAYLTAAAVWANLIVCAWGAHGVHHGREGDVIALLRQIGKPLHVLGLTRAGAPRHPLYLPYSAAPQPWMPHALLPDAKPNTTGTSPA